MWNNVKLLLEGTADNLIALQTVNNYGVCVCTGIGQPFIFGIMSPGCELRTKLISNYAK